MFSGTVPSDSYVRVLYGVPEPRSEVLYVLGGSGGLVTQGQQIKDGQWVPECDWRLCGFCSPSSLGCINTRCVLLVYLVAGVGEVLSVCV